MKRLLKLLLIKICIVFFYLYITIKPFALPILIGFIFKDVVGFWGFVIGVPSLFMLYYDILHIDEHYGHIFDKLFYIEETITRSS